MDKIPMGNSAMLIKSYTPPGDWKSTLPDVYRPNWSWSSRSSGCYSQWNERISPSGCHKFNLFKGLMSCSSISLFATSSFLIYLSYTAIREYLSRKHQSSTKAAALENSNRYPQGYIWLVNLFVAGTAKRCL